MAKERILAVEDETDILELIKFNLGKEGFHVEGVTSGEDALKAVNTSPPDLILLDLMLPGVDGIEVCRTLKKDPRHQHVPIIMLTAKGEEADIVTGLELGADDYVTKPFSPRIVVARVKAVLRRKNVPPPDEKTPLQMNGLSIHPGRHEVRLNDQPVELTFSEFKLLYFLAQRPGWVFTRYQIVREVHGEDYPVTDRSVDVQIVGLRKKLGSFGKHIETVRGVGYRFKE